MEAPPSEAVLPAGAAFAEVPPAEVALLVRVAFAEVPPAEVVPPAGSAFAKVPPAVVVSPVGASLHSEACPGERFAVARSDSAQVAESVLPPQDD